MVGVAQLVERQIVALNVAGSSPVTHPILYQRQNFFRGGSVFCFYGERDGVLEGSGWVVYGYLRDK